MSDDLQGKIIRGYQLSEVIGSGGFGVVYKAHQPIIERDVAIKIIHSKYANQLDFTRRFELEARLIARLESQYIVPVYDFWRDPSGAYLVMRWLRGNNLRAALNQYSQLPMNFVVKILFQLVSALDIAHQHGVVHRDIKPENVLFDEQQNVYLTDFGIAVDILHMPNQVTMKTLSLGSPIYMAPEQLVREATSPHADVYSLGIMLYEMLTGKMPFHGNMTEIIKLKREAFLLPSLQESRQDLPPALDAVLWQATAHSPFARYRSVVDFFNAFIKVMPTQVDFSMLQSLPLGDNPPNQPLMSRNNNNNTLPLNRDTHILNVNSDEKKPPNKKVSTTRQLEASIRNPFKGLRPFDEIDAHDFFGRGEAIKRLCDFFAEKDNRFLAVVGPSGSGKSSLVRAGLLAVVRQQSLPNSKNWIISTMTPGDNPFLALTEALAEVTFLPQLPETADLQDAPENLHLRLSAILPDNIDLFLLIDQFEELFTIGGDEQATQRFLDMLHDSLTHPFSRLHVILTLRADYYDRPLQHQKFGELIRKHTEVVLPLSDLALEEIIIEPSLQVGLTVQPDLKMAILNDLSGQQGALPLLQYTLSELYENRQGSNSLTLATYQQLGGISGALSRRAESIYSDLTETEQKIAQQLFLRCVTVEGGGTPTRKRVLMTTLLLNLPPDQRPILADVVEQFTRWRLLTLDRDSLSRSPTIDIAHEALISAWSRLHGWIDENRSDLRRYYQLQLLTQAWIEANHDSSFLAVGARLTEFEALLTTPFITLSADESAFISSGMALKKRRENRTRLAIVMLVLFSIFASGLALFALTQQQLAISAQAEALAERDRANTTAQISRSRELAANTLSVLDTPDIALLLGYYATQISDTFEARNSLLTALQNTPNITAYAQGHEGEVRGVAYSADGTWAVSAGEDRIIRVWDTDGWQLKTTIQTNHTDIINAIAIYGDTIFSASADGTISQWGGDSDTSTPIQVFLGHNSPIWDMAVNPDGTRLVSGAEDGTLIVWDVATGAILHRIQNAHDNIIYAVAFSPSGTILATGGADNLVRFWDVTTGTPLADATPMHTNWVSALAFSPTGKQLVSGGADSTLVFWDMADFSPIQSVTLEADSWIRGLTYSATGEMLALVGLDGSLRMWDAISGQLLGEPYVAHQSGVWDVDASPLGNDFVTVGADGLVIAWDFTPPYRPATRVFITGREAMTMGLNPATAQLGVGLSNGDIQLWDLTAGTRQTRLTGHEVAIEAMAYSPSGAYLATVDSGRNLIVWRVADETIIYQGTLNEAISTPNLVFNADESSLFIAGDEVLLRVAIATTPPTITPISINGDSISTFEVSPNGELLAVGGQSGAITLIHLANPTIAPIQFTGHANVVTTLAFAENGGLLISGSRDNTLIIWDIATRSPLFEPLRAHTDWVMDVAISPDERLMASASRDQTVILWDLTTARPLGAPFTGHRNWVQNVIFATDGNRLYSAGLDGVVFEWMVSVSDWQMLACQVSNRDFRDDEWARYFDSRPESCVGS
ncbi:MAG: protein kinase [bacterium]|nr:protein kinase [bacterium]